MSRRELWLWARRAAVAVAATWALSCVVRPVGEPSPVDTVNATTWFPQTLERDVDILFVIDNSGSMDEEQRNLAQQFPLLIEALRSETLGRDPDSDLPCSATDASGCDIPNVHIGVVSTDLGAGSLAIERCAPEGDRGILQNAPRIAGCVPPAQRFITYIGGGGVDPGESLGSIDQVEDAFSCIARLGIAGCGFEHPLEAARRALDPARTPENEGFVRDNALLAVVFITDEDDCSAAKEQLFDPGASAAGALGPFGDFRCFRFGIECDVNAPDRIGARQDCHSAGDWLVPVQEYVDFFRRRKPPGRIILSAIDGPTNHVEVGRQDDEPTLRPSCTSGLGEAAPAIRIQAVVDAFAPDSELASICDGDFGPAMQALGRKILGKLGAQCLGAPVLTVNGGLACQQGDTFADGQTCAASCLHRAACDVIEHAGPERPSTVVARCPEPSWYPTDWEGDRACPAGGPCPCWRLVRKPASAGPGKRCDPADDGSPYALDILRDGEPGPGTSVEASCLLATARWSDGALGQIPECL